MGWPAGQTLGLLLISDATHVMTAIGFVGINVAIQDAIATAKLPTDPMKQGSMHTVVITRELYWLPRDLLCLSQESQ